MGEARFTEEQKLRIFREHSAGADMTVVCRRHGVSSTTVCKWRSRYAGVDSSELRRSRALEVENMRSKVLLAESVLEVLRPSGLLMRILSARVFHSGFRGPVVRSLGSGRLWARRGAHRGMCWAVPLVGSAFFECFPLPGFGIGAGFVHWSVIGMFWVVLPEAWREGLSRCGNRVSARSVL